VDLLVYERWRQGRACLPNMDRAKSKPSFFSQYWLVIFQIESQFFAQGQPWTAVLLPIFPVGEMREACTIPLGLLIKMVSH
jgi:hypothetical protein